MADTAQPKVFDFDAAVAEAKKSFPEETEGVTFINTSAENADAQIREFAEKAGLNDRQIERLFKHKYDETAVASEYNGHRFLLVPATREAGKGAFPDDQYKSNYFTFQHELGHIVVPKALGDKHGKDDDWREHAADFYALARGIQAGVFTKQDLVDSAAHRAGIAIFAYSDTKHITTMSLDAMAINPRNIDFMSLSGEQIKAVAQEHAGAFQFTSGADSKFSKMQATTMSMWDWDDITPMALMRLSKLHDICREAPANSQEFYLSARILNNVMETGLLSSNYVCIQVDTDTDEWKKTKEIIREKTGDRDIGAKKALENSNFVNPQKKDEDSALASFARRFVPQRLKI